jgi:hypothetical protein
VSLLTVAPSDGDDVLLALVTKRLGATGADVGKMLFHYTRHDVAP